MLCDEQLTQITRYFCTLRVLAMAARNNTDLHRDVSLIGRCKEGATIKNFAGSCHCLTAMVSEIADFFGLVFLGLALFV